MRDNDPQRSVPAHGKLETGVKDVHGLQPYPAISGSGGIVRSFLQAEDFRTFCVVGMQDCTLHSGCVFAPREFGTALYLAELAGGGPAAWADAHSARCERVGTFRGVLLFGKPAVVYAGSCDMCVCCGNPGRYAAGIFDEGAGQRVKYTASLSKTAWMGSWTGSDLSGGCINGGEAFFPLIRDIRRFTERDFNRYMTIENLQNILSIGT